MRILKQVEHLDTQILSDSVKLVETEIAIADLSVLMAEHGNAKHYYLSALDRLKAETDAPFAISSYHTNCFLTLPRMKTVAILEKIGNLECIKSTNYVMAVRYYLQATVCFPSPYHSHLPSLFFYYSLFLFFATFFLCHPFILVCRIGYSHPPEEHVVLCPQ